MSYNTKGKVLKKAVVWKDLYFYRKSDAIYQLTVEFCHRFLPSYGDRTVDQMVQAARSGKQNIVEGSEDGQTSSEMEIKLMNVARGSLQELRADYNDYLNSCKLMNVARGSLQELRADYNDYLNTHHLTPWSSENPRQQRLKEFCHSHNDYGDYARFVAKMNDEEMANLLLTLCHQTDKMMCAYIENLEHKFVTEGGIKERMHAARTGYRKEQDAKMLALEEENKLLKKRVAELEKEMQSLK